MQCNKKAAQKKSKGKEKTDKSPRLKAKKKNQNKNKQNNMTKNSARDISCSLSQLSLQLWTHHNASEEFSFRRFYLGKDR